MPVHTEPLDREADVPEPARLIRDFLNTLERQIGDESLDTPAALRGWMAGRGLLDADARLDEHDLAAATAIREGLREVLRSHTPEPADAADQKAVAAERHAVIGAMNRALGDLPMRVEITVDTVRTLPTGDAPFARAISGILDAVRQTREAGGWSRLKICARHSCLWAFYDTSRNQTRRWCSMAGCGNHVKMKRAYARRTGRG
ncbi:CGNR zinc finger domain-containing protein [Pseudactinotalea suaedae]|uniref:CGNR zinc finger domain-containing protein n=1 Tax=Pseudactinotalea suaedae TaxID=1524924 RepID=UPI0012E21768|nr:CGNR zinc finger domain-containing protein [Pseudactinotalea suaedae]